MNKVNCTFSLIFFCVLFFSKIQAQSSEKADSVFYQQSLANVIDKYVQAVGVLSPLYKGKEYLDYTFSIEGDQYFKSYLWEKGSVCYDGLSYSDITMKYDLVNEVVVVDHAHLPASVALESARVARFSLLDHHFIRLVSDTLTHVGIPTGFYDLLYESDIRFLVHRAKVLKKEIEDMRMHHWFEETDRYYIYKDNIYHKVKSKRSVLEVLNSHKKDIKKFLKRNKIKFRKQREEAIHSIVRYYDQQIQ